MVALKDKIKLALDESRILVYGVQILLGFEYNSVFQKGFASLPESSQAVKLVSMGLILLSIAFIMAPPTYHQVAYDGEESKSTLRYITFCTTVALLPFSFGLAGDIYVVVEKVSGTLWGIVAAVLGAALALFFLYGLELMMRKRPLAGEKGGLVNMGDVKEKGQGKEQEGQSEEDKLKDKLNFLLTEARVVIPGTQALLGFQFISMLTEQFDKLPPSMKYMHLASLALMAISTLLLMAPAAYHRISEAGEITKRLYRFSNTMLLSGMVFLALGMAGDLYVVAQKITDSYLLALLFTIIMLIFYFGLWFGYSLLRRGQRSQSQQAPEQASAA